MLLFSRFKNIKFFKQCQGLKFEVSLNLLLQRINSYKLVKRGKILFRCSKVSSIFTNMIRFNLGKTFLHSKFSKLSLFPDKLKISSCQKLGTMSSICFQLYNKLFSRLSSFRLPKSNPNLGFSKELTCQAVRLNSLSFQILLIFFQISKNP